MSRRVAPASDGRRIPVWVWIVVPLVAVAAVLLWRAGAAAGEGPRRTWFYDLNTRQLFPMPYGTLPPVDAPSGDLHGAPPGTPAGVAAMVLRPVAGGEPVIAWLETRPPGAPAADPAQPGRAPPGLMLRLVVASEWTPCDSAKARAVYEQAAQLTAGVAVRQDFP